MAQDAGLAGRVVAESKRPAEQSTTLAKAAGCRSGSVEEGAFSWWISRSTVHHHALASGSLPPSKVAGFRLYDCKTFGAPRGAATKLPVIVVRQTEPRELFLNEMAPGAGVLVVVKSTRLRVQAEARCHGFALVDPDCRTVAPFDPELTLCSNRYLSMLTRDGFRGSSRGLHYLEQ